MPMYVDRSIPGLISGWAYAKESPHVTLRLFLDKELVGTFEPNVDRMDVNNAHNLPPDYRSGFRHFFVPPEPTKRTPIPYKIELLTNGGTVDSSLEGIIISGAPAADTAYKRLRSGYPPAVERLMTDALGLDWCPPGFHQADTQMSVANLIATTMRNTAAYTDPELIDYIKFMSGFWAHVQTVYANFPLVNRAAQFGDKDWLAIQSSVDEMMAIGHHIYVLSKHGHKGAVCEFGCFKGVSTAALSFVCAWNKLPMHVFDSFEGLPPSNSSLYEPGEFAGDIDEVTENVKVFGADCEIHFHKGFFKDVIGGLEPFDIMTIWMDVDLEQSVKDLLSVFPWVLPEGAIFSHECHAEWFKDGKVMSSPSVVSDIIAAFKRANRRVRGSHIVFNTGAFWDADAGIQPVPSAALFTLLRGIGVR